MDLIGQMKDKILSATNVAVFGHTSVDGDCVGSLCSMAMLLEKLGKNVKAFVDSEIPHYLTFIPYSDKINTSELEISEFDLLISLDTATTFKLGKYGEAFESFPNTLLIDHHVSNSKYAKLCYIEPHAPACGQVLFNFLEKCDFEITPDMASAMLAAIISDTNNFTNSDVTNKTFEVTSKLMSLKADFEKVVYATQKKKTLNQVRVASFMSKNVKLNGEVAYLVVTQRDCKKLHCMFSDISKFLTLIVDIAGAKITAIFKEKGKNLWSVSFRSCANYDVNAVASKFGGGGHVNAAGCTVNGKINKLKKEVFAYCNEQIKKVGEENAK